MTKVDGIKVKHLWISDACREAHGDMDAMGIALDQIKESYHEILANWPRGKGTKFHVVLTVDYPRTVKKP